MISKTTSIILTLIAIAGAALVGCQSVVDRLTPCDVPKPVSTYLDLDNTIEISSLYDFREYTRQLIVQHREKQKEVIRAAQDDDDFFNDAVGPAKMAIKEAEEWQAMMLGDENSPGLIGLGLAAIGIGGGTLLGKNYLRRPSDWTQEEVDVAVAEAVAESKNG